MSEKIVLNAKCQRPGSVAVETCGSSTFASQILPPLISRLQKAGVEIRGCSQTLTLLPGLNKATEDDWYAEYLALILAVKIVKNITRRLNILKPWLLHTDNHYPILRKFAEIS
jgi:glutamate-5-semialdehyde dehydrogenase